MYNLTSPKPTRKRDNDTPMRDRNQVVLPIDLEICISKKILYSSLLKYATICVMILKNSATKEKADVFGQYLFS